MSIAGFSQESGILRQRFFTERGKALSDTELPQPPDADHDGDDATVDAAEDGAETDGLRDYDFSLRGDLSEGGMAAAKALGSMDRAARSFTLYDPANEAVAHFLQDIEENFATYFRQFGDLVLLVRPYELMVEGESIYQEEDREKSLAFKLFRDGVRRLVVKSGAPWEELLQLLQILSVRFSGVRSNEDDMVTLLWKAGFSHIEVDAVEGFVPEDEEEARGDLSDEELRQRVNRRSLSPGEMGAGLLEESSLSGLTSTLGEAVAFSPQSSGAPEDFDLPLSEFPGAVTPVYRFVEDADFERLLSEDSSSALAGDCIDLVQLLVESAKNSDRIEPEDFLPLLVEIRDFMLTQGQLENLMLLLESVGDYAAEFESGHPVHAMLGSFANMDALSRLIRSVPKTIFEPPPEFYELLDGLPGDHLETLLKILLQDRTAHSRRITRQMIERFGHGRVEQIRTTLLHATGAVAADLMRALSVVSPEDALDVTHTMMDRQEIEVLLECMHLLERYPDSAQIRPVVLGMMRAKEESIRIRAIALVGKRANADDFSSLQTHILTRNLGMTKEEALAVGLAMAQVDPSAAMELFEDWLRPKGLLKRMRPVQKGQDIAAIGGLENLDFEEADELLKILAKRAGGVVYDLCMNARSRRRHRMQASGGA